MYIFIYMYMLLDLSTSTAKVITQIKRPLVFDFRHKVT